MGLSVALRVLWARAASAVRQVMAVPAAGLVSGGPVEATAARVDSGALPMIACFQALGSAP